MLLSAVRMISRKNGGEGSHFMLCWCVFVLQALVINKQAVKEQTTSFIQEENCFVFWTTFNICNAINSRERRKIGGNTGGTVMFIIMTMISVLNYITEQRSLLCF